MEMLTEKQTTNRREERRQDRRQAIIDAARRSFLDQGYAATSMSGLLTTLGGSKATLWSYFRSKEELFAAVVEDLTFAFRRELESALVTPGDIETALVTFCKGFMAKTASPDTVGAWRLIVGESGRFPELGQIFYEKAARHLEGALARYIAAQIATGVLRAEDPEKMAQFLLGLCATQHNRRLWGIASPSADGISCDAARFTGYFMQVFGAASDRTKDAERG